MGSAVISGESVPVLTLGEGRVGFARYHNTKTNIHGVGFIYVGEGYEVGDSVDWEAHGKIDHFFRLEFNGLRSLDILLAVLNRTREQMAEEGQ